MFCLAKKTNMHYRAWNINNKLKNMAKNAARKGEQVIWRGTASI